jgi:hypothetical protein
MAAVLHASINEWITAGRGWVKHQAARSDVALICISPHLFKCKRPCAAWCARQQGVSREYAARLCREFAGKFGDYIQFRGKRFLNQQTRLGRGRQEPGTVAGVLASIPDPLRNRCIHKIVRARKDIVQPTILRESSRENFVNP